MNSYQTPALDFDAGVAIFTLQRPRFLERREAVFNGR